MGKIESKQTHSLWVYDPGRTHSLASVQCALRSEQISFLGPLST